MVEARGAYIRIAEGKSGEKRRLRPPCARLGGRGTAAWAYRQLCRPGLSDLRLLQVRGGLRIRRGAARGAGLCRGNLPGTGCARTVVVALRGAQRPRGGQVSGVLRPPGWYGSLGLVCLGGGRRP